MAEITQTIVDGGGREHKKRLRSLGVIEQIVQSVVAGGFDVIILPAFPPWIAEVVGLVDDHDIGQLRDAPETLWKVASPAKVRVAEDGKVAKVCTATHASDVRKPFAQVRLPDALLCRLRGKQDDALSFMKDEALDEH